MQSFDTRSAARFAISANAGETATGRTPAGLQSRSVLRARRLAMLGLCTVTLIAVLWGVARVFSVDGLDGIEIGLLLAVGLSAPWTILGFWNAVLGLALVFAGRAEANATASELLSPEFDDGPVRSRVALAIAIRNEDAARVLARALAMRRSLDETGHGDHFDLHLLSDTDDPAIAAAEARLFVRYREELGGTAQTQYRRRNSNTGYKAGNIQDFLESDGARYDFFIPLDADSLMSGETMLRMVRVMEAYPRIGILQSLAVGSPSKSGFGRIFQFGMRHGMRGFTLGSAWWQGDCGPFWGHNAAVRTAVFRDACKLPSLGGRPPLGGEILSHDQIEATLMRRAGYEVRVLPVECESFEENPVTVLDFIQREQRWCNGNIQYFRLLNLQGLLPVSRFQLVQAIMMYLSAPAWMLLTGLGALKAVLDSSMQFDRPLAIALFAILVTMSLTPKIVGALHVMLQKGGGARYGGRRRFVLGLVLETIFSVLMAPVVALHLSIFLIGLFLGRRIDWNGQTRDVYGLRWRSAARAFWPQTLFGGLVLGAIWSSAPAAILWVLPVIAGLLLAIPFAVVTSSPRLGAWLKRRGLCAIPEDFDRPAILDLLEAPAPAPVRSAAA